MLREVEGFAALPLDAALIAAHGARDHDRLVTLYRRAAAEAEAEGREEAAWFYLTHALVYALETGDPAEPAIRARLAAAGREAP